ncbi:MAG: DUF5916 domain-containing protein [Candidatus Aminicenantaceae bacterium]
MKRTAAFVLIALLVGPVWAGTRPETTKRVYKTRRVEPQPPIIDGVLDDPAWQSGDWQGDFIQREPYEGKPPSQQTKFNILYDDKYLYVAIRAHDTEPDRIERRLSRRDTIEGDSVGIDIDSYFDKRTSFGFVVNAAGVKRDLVISNDGDDADMNWDPIWLVKTSRDEQGWNAEMRIPLSQLRFAGADSLTWGLQVHRTLFRKDEQSLWQFIPRDSAGWVHEFGELRGLDGIKPPRQVEIVPYLVGRYQSFQPDEGNPFTNGQDGDLQAGLDGKLGVTNNLTMNFTINPDFGQVEADPSVVNLTAYETYFEEKRPFFIEGRNILSFPIMIGDGDLSGDNLFYTRRIGSRPRRNIYPGPGDFVSMPDNTSIIGAFKLTGKTRSGISIGLIDSLTAREYARIGSGGPISKEQVEPLTNYFGLRLQKDYNQGKTSVGAMATATHRDLNEPSLSFLHQAAYSGGIDFEHSWKDRTYHLVARAVFSHVQGSEEALLRTQRSSLRYYQRPDVTHVTLDPTRQSLSGHGGTAYAAKLGKGHLSYMAGVTWRSPGLELNDMGYQRQADNILQWLWGSYRIWEPFFIFREVNIQANQWRGWNFGGTKTVDGGNLNFNTELKNYWSLGTGVNLQLESLSPSALRGGPMLRNPGGWNLWYSLGTDQRQKARVFLIGSQYWGDHDNSRQQNYTVSVSYQPSNALNLALSPSYSLSTQNLQYVQTVSLDTDKRYIMGRIHQKTLAVTLRLNFSLTPDLSVQFYGQPFVSAGDYTQFKRITQPRADAYSDRFHTYADAELTFVPEANHYAVDETGDGQTDYVFGNPNFKVMEFRSNLVMRWEYFPGSSLYLVWSQGRTGFDSTGNFTYEEDIQRLFDLPPHNVFLIKFSYCFQL